MRKSILIVDDEFGLADLLADILTEQGFDVRIAINGRLGLAALGERPADLVLLDGMMPVMDGPEMLREMRADPRFASIPVVMMTALPEALPKIEGASGLLTKPFSAKDLHALLQRLLP